MPLRRLQVLLAGGLALGTALFISNPGPSEAESGVRNLKERRLAPDFLLTDVRGAQIKLSDYRGKVVLLNFWATWCGPCKAEVPWFVEFENQHKSSGFAVLGVSMDDDGWKSVGPFIQQQHINYAVALGDNTLSATFGGIDSLPETFLLDREGRIAAKYVGLTSKSHYEDGIVELLGE